MRPTPSQGRHNPNGHTESAVLRAIQGLDGSSRWTFRYELLDQNDRVLRHMDDSEVEANSGQVNVNNLAEIQRDAHFRIRAGARIDWLSDRIKPWARLHLPPYGEDDWVEWSLGVFLPETPDRHVDVTGTVWREVAAVDKTAIPAGEELPGRYSTAGHLDASDTFLRDLAGTWGTPDIGAAWAQSTSPDVTFAVTSADGGYASATLTANPSVVRASVINRRYRDAEIRTRIAVDQVATGGAMLPAVLLRNLGASDYYRVRLHFNTDSTVHVAVTNGVTLVGSVVDTGLTYTPGEWFNVRARLVGQEIQGRVWADGAPEPAEWTIEETVETATLAEGQFGLTSSTFNTNTNTDPQLRYEVFEMDANPTDLVTGHVRRALEQGGITRHNITPSSETLPGVREWEPGTTRLAIINDLLGSISYRGLAFDEDGVAVCGPYISPAERAPEYTYADDHASIMLPDMVETLDLHAIPNQWTLTSSEADSDPWTVTFTNSDPSSPTSTASRGRVISESRTEQDAASESALIEQAARIAVESSQVYEAVDMSTALNPLHSAHDVVRLRRDDVAIDAVYASHTWEMPLDPGAIMRHRIRRVVTLGTPSDPSIVVGDATITGAVEAGNWATLTQLINPTPNVPTMVEVTGLDLAGTGPVRVQATAHSTVPGSTFVEVGIRNPSPTGFRLYVYRRTSTATEIYLLAIRGA